MRLLAIVTLGLLLHAAAAPAQNVLTQHNDVARTGANLQETELTPAKVRSGFGSLFSLSVDGQIYAQPLVVNQVEIPGKGVHNVVYVATMKNNVYAFDADHPNDDCPLWKRNLGKPVPYKLIPLNWGSLVGQYNIKPFMGITSTPVIDPDGGKMWLTAKVYVADDDIRYYLYTLDIRTGELLATSPPIQPEVDKAKLEARNVLQRPGLLRANGMVYLAFGSEFDGGLYHGWLVAFDEQTLEQKYVFCSTPGDLLGEGGIWQAGNGPAADADGNLYVMTGNGAYDPDKNRYGSSFLKLSPQLKVLDWFTPSDYLKENLEDLDLGSAGPLLIPGSDQIVGGGKEGIFYLLDRKNMGHLQPGHSVAPALQQFRVANHFSLSFLSLFIPVFGYHHIHGSPVYWNSAAKGPMVYVWPEESPLKAFHYGPVQHFDPKAALVGPKAPKGMPGGFLSISANGNHDGLLWASSPLKEDAFVKIVKGKLQVYDAETLELLWSTEKNEPDEDYNFSKYCPPTVANGKVYLATFSDRLNVYGIVPTPAPLPAWVTSGQPAGKRHAHGRPKL